MKMILKQCNPAGVIHLKSPRRAAIVRTRVVKQISGFKRRARSINSRAREQSTNSADIQNKNKINEARKTQRKQKKS